jgi:hypothetical protein
MRWALLGPACGVAALAWGARAQSCDGEDGNWLIKSYRNPLGNCSGAGVCAAGECECMPGYTGLSDVVNMQGLDCQIFEPAIVALWGVNLLVTSVVLVISAPQLKARWRQHQANVATQHAGSGRQVSILQNKGLISMAVWVLWVAPSLIALALVRLADSSQRIGITWAITLLFVWLRIGFYTVAYTFQTGLSKSRWRGGAVRTARAPRCA